MGTEEERWLISDWFAEKGLLPAALFSLSLVQVDVF